jgi:hypothetical protein
MSRHQMIVNRFGGNPLAPKSKQSVPLWQPTLSQALSPALDYKKRSVDVYVQVEDD